MLIKYLLLYSSFDSTIRHSQWMDGCTQLSFSTEVYTISRKQATEEGRPSSVKSMFLNFVVSKTSIAKKPGQRKRIRSNKRSGRKYK